MQERERTVATGLVVLMVVLWLGFPLHRSPRFPGSLFGGILGVAGAILMLVPLAYLLVKRIAALKAAVTHRVSMRTLLAVHIYCGIVGPILALLHTGHRFGSPLGIALTAMMLIVVLSGFIGRYLLTQISRDVREKRNVLSRLEVEYRRTAAALATHPCCAPAFRPIAGLWRRLVMPFLVTSAATGGEAMTLSSRAIDLSYAIADLEYAIATHETVKRAFAGWLKFHTAISGILYVLLGLHMWASIHFGLRWFD